MNLSKQYNVSPEFIFQQIQSLGSINKMDFSGRAMDEWAKILGASSVALPQFQQTLKKRIEDVRRTIERIEGIKIETTDQLLNVLETLRSTGQLSTITVGGQTFSISDIIGQIKLLRAASAAPDVNMDLSTPEKINYETARLLKETATILDKITTKV